MRSEVMYRDLPGGPLLVKFADEVSLWCLCSKCGMFSKDMFQDSASHVFCSVCIFECSAKKRIHCKHERKDVPVDDMVQAVDVGHVMRDQIVFCPNSKDGGGCAEFCALKDLEGHYLKCAETQITCLSCGSVVKGPQWEHHIRSCPQQILQCRHCAVATPRCRLQAHEQQCHENPEARYKPKNTVPVSDSSTSCSKPSPRKEITPDLNSAAANGAPVNETHPLRDDVGCDDSTLQCIYCNRNVKRKNMEHHVRMCAQNKVNSPASTVVKLPGNVQIAPDSRNTTIVGPNDSPREATPLQDSFASWDQVSLPTSWTHYGGPTDPPYARTCSTPLGIVDMAEEAQPESSIWNFGVQVANTMGAFSFDRLSNAVEILKSLCWSNTGTTQAPQDSYMDHGATLPSCAETLPDGTPPPWPELPCYQNVSEWFDQLDAWLVGNDITREEQKFPLLLNKMPERVSSAFLSLQNHTHPYTELKLTVLHFFQTQGPQ